MKRASIISGDSKTCQVTVISVGPLILVNPETPILPLDALPWWAPGIVVLAFGLLTCLYGYKILKVVIFMLGIVSGAYAGLLYAPLLFADSPKVVWVVAGVLGLSLGVLMNFFYKAGVFVLGAYGTAVILLPLLQSLQDIAAIGVLVVAILVGGFMALKLEKWSMKAATAAVGAWHAVQSVFFLLKLSPFPWGQILDKYGGASLHDVFERPIYFWISVLGLSIGGFYMQFRGKKKKD